MLSPALEYILGALALFTVIALPYLPGILIPRPVENQRFWTLRQSFALIILCGLAPLGASMLAWSNIYDFIPIAIIVLFLFPAFICGLAGRKPFFYGAISSSAILIVCYWFFTAKVMESTFGTHHLAFEWLLLCVSVVLLFGQLACWPLSAYWKRRDARAARRHDSHL